LRVEGVFQETLEAVLVLAFTSSLLKNFEMESFRILADRCWSGAVELEVIL
jgi:hypothetical protein